MTLKPSLRHSKEGQAIIKSKQRADDIKYGRVDENEVGGDQSEDPKDQKKEPKDFTKVFPGVFLTEKERALRAGPSVAKLRGDELIIMRELVQKYGDDLEAMFRDIKTNVLQWSVGQIKKKREALFAHKYKDVDQQD